MLFVAFALIAAISAEVPAESKGEDRNQTGEVAPSAVPVTEVITHSTQVPDNLIASLYSGVIPTAAKTNPQVPVVPPNYPLPRNYNFQVSAMPIPYEPRYFTDRTKSDMIEFLDRAARDVDFAESQISLATEHARAAVSNDVNEAKKFVIKNHEKELNDAVENAKDEEILWECLKEGEKFIEIRARIAADRVNDCMKKASGSAMDVVSSTKSHIAEDKTRRLQKYKEDVERLTSCVRQQDRNCIREQINLIDRNVNGLAADAKSEVERVRDARRQQIVEFGVCRRFQDESYLNLKAESDRIVKCCIKSQFHAPLGLCP